MKNILVIGSGGFSKQVIEIIEKINEQDKQYHLVGIIDDNKELADTFILGYKVIGDTNYLKNYSLKNKVYGVIAIANPKIREMISNKLSRVCWINLIHPTANVSKYKQVGIGNIICAGVVINPDFTIGNHCHINIGSTLGHDVMIRDYVTLMPGCRISGNVFLESHSTVGTGAIIIQGLILGNNTILGAGAVLTKNAEKRGIYVGIPAKLNNEE